MAKKPEDKACNEIDEKLMNSGWRIYHVKDANIHSDQGVVLRYFPLKAGHKEIRFSGKTSPGSVPWKY